MTRSTNFEFMRDKCVELADEAAVIEGLVHGNEPQAINLLCSFGEKLLQLFVVENGGRVAKADSSMAGETIEFRQLILECENESLQWHVDEPVRNVLDRLRSEGNRVKHRLKSRQRFDARVLLQDAWVVAGWVWRKLRWGNAAEQFVEPPRGGREIDEAHRQRVELSRELGDEKRRNRELEQRNAELLGPAKISHWIRSEQQTFRVPPNFVGREFVSREIARFLKDGTQRVLLIEGEPGRGKTGLIAKFLSNQNQVENKPIAFGFVYQASQSEESKRQWIRYFYASLLERWNLTEMDHAVENADADDLAQRFLRLLRDRVNTNPSDRVLIVIDAVDEAGVAEKSVTSFLLSVLPSNVQVIVTSRPNHVPHEITIDDQTEPALHLVDLESADLANKHRLDGLEFVKKTLRNLSETAIDEVSQLGDGNFLVLTLVCSELKTIPDHAVASHLAKLSRLKKAGRNLLEELYKRCWDRLEQSVDADLLDTIYNVARLLAIAKAPLSVALIRESLQIRDADWAKARRHLEEYLHAIEFQPPFIARTAEMSATSDDQSDEEVTTFRLFHETFSACVREKLKGAELQDCKTRLGECCRNRLSSADRSYEYAYALRFVVEHLIDAVPLNDAKRWSEVVEVLTDLDFIQTRFVANQEYELLEDYDLAFRKHPESKEDFARRDKQDMLLRAKIEEFVEYSRRCTRIRTNHACGQVLDPIAAIQAIPIPEPLDTSSTIAAMEETESSQRRQSANRNNDSTVTRLREFQWFVTSQFNAIRELPNTTRNIAFNFAATGHVADAVKVVKKEDCLGSEVMLVRTNRKQQPRPDSLVLRVFDEVVKDDGDDAHWAAMTADARIGYGSSDRVWNLRTGKSLLKNQGRFCVGDVTIDGRWAVISRYESDKTFIRLVDVERDEGVDGPQLFSPHYFYSTVGVTPDGKRVAYIDRSLKRPEQYYVVVWDIDTNATSRIRIRERWPSRLLLGMSGMIVGVKCENDWTFLDLANRKRIGPVCPRNVLKCLANNWFGDDVHFTARMKWSLRTLDGKLQVDHTGFDFQWDSMTIRQSTDEKPIRQFESNLPFKSIESISADGRYAMAVTEKAFCLLDLANGTLRQSKVAVDPETESTTHEETARPKMQGREGWELASELELELSLPADSKY